MSADSLAPHVVSRLMSEVKSLIKKPLEDIEYIEGGDNSISEVHCYITGPKDTPYYGGKFRVKLVLKSDYPASPPRGFFLTRIYHPNVAANGDICVNTLKKDWKPDVTLGHIFQVIRCLLIIPFPESSLNDEAGKLFMDNYEDFARRARIMTDVHAIPVDASSASVASSGSSSAAAAASSSSSSSSAVSKKAASPPPSAEDAAFGSGSGSVFVKMATTAASSSDSSNNNCKSGSSGSEGTDENNNENANNKQSADGKSAVAVSSGGNTGTGGMAAVKKTVSGGGAGAAASKTAAATAKKKSLKRL